MCAAWFCHTQIDVTGGEYMHSFHKLFPALVINRLVGAMWKTVGLLELQACQKATLTTLNADLVKKCADGFCAVSAGA
eukprot:717126-Pyramimonas_sp.AAC.1